MTQPPYPPPPGPPPGYQPGSTPATPAGAPPQQAYGAPQYPAAGYPAPPQQATTTSGWAVASLITGILGLVLFSVIFGFIGLSKTKNGKQRGRGMAIAGLVFSALWIVIILIAVFVIVLSSDDKDTVRATAIRVGDCVNTPTDGLENVATLPKVPCDQPHEGEVYAIDKVTATEFPGQTALENEHELRCLTALEAFSPNAAADPEVNVSILYPTQDTWDIGDRDVVCIAMTPDKRPGTLREQFP